jgi:hypothetical protein
MKRNVLMFLLALMVYNLDAQNLDFIESPGAIGKDDWTKLWTSYKPNSNSYHETTIELSGVITKNATLSKRNTYLLKGIVYVSDNATVTIEPGTVIRGDASTCGTLVIAKGGKLIANGTETDPIVFTSNLTEGGRSAGDWGGIIILGSAPINKIPGMAVLDWNLETKYAYYGGNIEDDNSGILKYVRIEYPGRKISKTVELNGLTLAGVGNGTTIENVQISYSNDDSFEMFGGSVHLKNIISYKCSDDDLDFNYGYEGKIQTGLIVRHPYICDFSGSRCIEAESYSGGRQTMNEGRRFTQIDAVNLTLVTLEGGPYQLKTSREAIFIGPDCSFTLRNSVISGFDQAVTNNDDGILGKISNNEFLILGSVLNNCALILKNKKSEKIPGVDLLSSNYKNRNMSISNKDLFEEASNPAKFNFKLRPIQIVSKDINK